MIESMEIPSPNQLKQANKGKSFVPKEEREATKLTPEERAAQQEARIEKQTGELMEKCITELQRYKGAAILVGAKYMRKEAILAVMEKFHESGNWKVTKSYDPTEQEIVLKFVEVK